MPDIKPETVAVLKQVLEKYDLDKYAPRYSVTKRWMLLGYQLEIVFFWPKDPHYQIAFDLADAFRANNINVCGINTQAGPGDWSTVILSFTDPI